MTSSEEQDNNIKWLKDFLSRPLSLSTNADVQCFSTGKYNQKQFNQAHFFYLSEICYKPNEKQFYYDESEVSEAAFDYLNDFFGKEDVIIGYELSNQTRKVLEKIGVVYIDIWLHPIRYLDDVLFGLCSNNVAIHSALSQFNIETETYYLYADRLKVQNYRGHRRSNAKLKANSALFVGQTLTDKAIFHNNKMLTLLDFKNEFEAAVKKYEHVYYSRHPFVKEGDEDILNYLKRFKNVSLNNDPAYHLLASPEIEYVFSISSSVVHEAKYFGKEVDFLYRPVITIGDGISNYQSVMHEIFYGHFWSQVLAPVIETNYLKPVSYFCGKDKTRDALSFYWGYRNIDKVESLKQTVSTLWNKNNSSTTRKNNRMPTEKNKTIYDIIDGCKIVSFDIFDTLVTRKSFSPREIFNIVEEKYNKKTSTKIRDFKQFRVIAENKAIVTANQAGRQDCTLDEIYLELKEILCLDDSIVEELKNIEVEVELDNIIRRDRGIELFEYAKKLNKKIILTSDMYLTSDIIVEMLDKNKISGYSKLYVSSEIGLKKKTGDLFKYVLEDNEILKSDIVHIGDNIDGDIKVPEGMGIIAYRIPRSLDIAKFKHIHLKEWIDSVSVNKTPLLDAVVTSIVNRYYDDELAVSNSLYEGNRFKFGYCAFGPLILGFTSWIRNELKNKNIKKVYFLSRDTKVVFDCFNLLYPNEGIQTSYLYSSRRSVKVPLYQSRIDLLSEVYKTIYSTTISKWLETRFGLTKDMYSEDVLAKFDLSGYDHPIGGKFSKEKLSGLVIALSDKILKNAKEEKETLKNYLVSEGMDVKEDVAIVDIGYAGTMQAAYRTILQKNNIHGLYYATFNTTIKNIDDLSLINGYSFNLGIPTSNKNGICTHRFFYESIFCDADYSFVKPIKVGDSFDFIKTDFDDSVRQSVVKDVHAGVLALAQDLKESYGQETLATPVDSELGAMLFDQFLKNPDLEDASIFKGVLFEDSVVPNARRYLFVPDSLSSDKTAISNMIWKEAASKFFKINDNKKTPVKQPINKVIQHSSTQENAVAAVKNPKLRALESRLIQMSLSDKKVKKYQRDRDLFFTDSKSSFITAYYKVLGRRFS